MMKRLLALLLVCAMMLGSLSGCGKKKPASAAPEDNTQPVTEKSMTREEWIIMLGSTMGMNNYASQEPHFTDVTSTRAGFPFIQSCFEWGLLENEGSTFRPDETATKEFIARTSALAAGAISGEEVTEGSVRKYAEDNNVVSADDNQWDEEITAEEALEAAKVTKQVYLDQTPDEVFEYTYTEGVVELTDSSTYVLSDGAMTIDANAGIHAEAGDVFVIPASEDDPLVTAVKVVSVSYDASGNAVLETTHPTELGEVYDYLHVSGVAVPLMDQIKPVEGVTMVSGPSPVAAGQESATLSTLVAEGDPAQAEQTAKGQSWEFSASLSGEGKKITSFSASIEPKLSTNFGEFSVNGTIEKLFGQSGTQSTQNDDGSTTTTTTTVTNTDSAAAQQALAGSTVGNPSNTGNSGSSSSSGNSGSGSSSGSSGNRLQSFKQKLDDKGFDVGWSINGSVTLSDFYVESDVVYKKFIGVTHGIERVVVEENYKSEIDLKFKGTVENDEIPLSPEIPLVLPGGVLKVDFRLYGYVEANGQVNLNFVFTGNQKFEYANGNTKTTDNSNVTSSIKAIIDAEAGLRPHAELVGLEFIDIIDLSVKAGVGIEGSASLENVHDETLEYANQGRIQTLTERDELFLVLTGKLTVPCVSVEFGGDKKTLANKFGLSGKWSLPKTWQKTFSIFAPEDEFRKSLSKRENVHVTVWPDTIPLEDIPGIPADAIFEVVPGANEFATLILDKMMLGLESGSSDTISVIGLPEGATMDQVRFSSKNPDVATVDQTGKVTGVKAGITEILVVVGGVSQSCSVSVWDASEQPNASDFQL